MPRPRRRFAGSVNRVVAGLIALSTLGGCVEELIDDPWRQTIQVTPDDKGALIDLTMDQVLEVRLPSNPTTGLQWFVSWDDTKVLEAVDEKPLFEPDQGALGRLGVGGHETWRFRPVGRGKTVVRFEYNRPWEHLPAIDSVMFSVSVR